MIWEDMNTCGIDRTLVKDEQLGRWRFSDPALPLAGIITTIDT